MHSAERDFSPFNHLHPIARVSRMCNNYKSKTNQDLQQSSKCMPNIMMQLIAKQPHLSLHAHTQKKTWLPNLGSPVFMLAHAQKRTKKILISMFFAWTLDRDYAIRVTGWAHVPTPGNDWDGTTALYILNKRRQICGAAFEHEYARAHNISTSGGIF